MNSIKTAEKCFSYQNVFKYHSFIKMPTICKFEVEGISVTSETIF